MGEWLKPAALKAVSPARGSRVRIPPSPFLYKKALHMRLKYRNRISIYSFFCNGIVLVGFFYLVLNAYKFSDFSTSKVQAYFTNLTYLTEEISD